MLAAIAISAIQLYRLNDMVKAFMKIPVRIIS